MQEKEGWSTQIGPWARSQGGVPVIRTTKRTKAPLKDNPFPPASVFHIDPTLPLPLPLSAFPETVGSRVVTKGRTGQGQNSHPKFHPGPHNPNTWHPMWHFALAKAPGVSVNQEPTTKIKKIEKNQEQKSKKNISLSIKTRSVRLLN